ncbi:MAG: permease-like cell division protein FtsX [Gemmatimonadaceae bacterium]|nr:permease-like cell division protein FtsX [Gemmatimonadaceae bacterium]MCW5825635.1 permease-like cell division protein FtsX [Gemmatimonadaceae bacterium]
MKLAFREAFRAFDRAPMLSALSVTTIAFSLFAFGLFGLVALNLRTALQQVEDRVEVRGFVAAGTPPEATAAAVDDVALFPEVQSVRLVTETQALERARRELREFEDVFESGLLPASIEVRLRPGMRDPATVRAVAKRLDTYDFIDDVRFGEEWVENLHRLRNIATGAGIALGVTFALVAIIIIGSTIRMAVLARSREIAIMRLVGATDGFIRAPFLIEGALKGTLGGLLALALTWTAVQVSGRWVFQVQFFDAQMAVFGVVAGAGIGLLGSALSVGRHLRKV